MLAQDLDRGRAGRIAGHDNQLRAAFDQIAAKVAPFFEKAKFRKLQAWHDPETSFSLQLGVNLPATILYDSSGREVWRRQGDTDWAGAAAAKLIAEAG